MYMGELYIVTVMGVGCNAPKAGGAVTSRGKGQYVWEFVSLSESIINQIHERSPICATRWQSPRTRSTVSIVEIAYLFIIVILERFLL